MMQIGDKFTIEIEEIIERVDGSSFIKLKNLDDILIAKDTFTDFAEKTSIETTKTPLLNGRFIVLNTNNENLVKGKLYDIVNGYFTLENPFGFINKFPSSVPLHSWEEAQEYFDGSGLDHMVIFGGITTILPVIE